jgi:hypothetical protein
MVRKNHLFRLPPEPLGARRPWLMWDYEDPIPKFRRIPFDSKLTIDTTRRFKYISPGDDPAALLDEPGEDRLPVMAQGYQ